MTETNDSRPTDEFSDQLDRWGADLDAWPADERARANCQLAASPMARAALEEALALRTLLNTVPPAEPRAALLRRLAEIPIAHPHRSLSWFWPFESLWRPLSGFAAAAAFGLLVGGVLPADLLGTEALADDDEWDDIAGLLAGDGVDTLLEAGEQI